MDAFDGIGDPRAITQIIVETIREPLLILNGELRILLATSSFCRLFALNQDRIAGVSVLELDNGAWDIPDLRRLLEETVSTQSSVENFEVGHDFPRVGFRTLLLNTRLVHYENADRTTVFLSFEDITVRRAIEQEKELLQERTQELLEQKEVLLREMEHRVVNSLQIIASILLLKAKAVSSPETRHHLEDAHRRVVSIAAVQQHLHSVSHTDKVDLATYLTKLCTSLSASIIAEDDKTDLSVVADAATVSSTDAVSIGLIVTELVINALKYAFPDRSDTAAVVVRYEKSGTDWRLSITDNGLGMTHDVGKPSRTGLGTSLVRALASQLDANVKTTSSGAGTSVVITHATFSKSA